ncbi:hypothetical protein BD560DRAFT_441937 [Blakeslea trispora]|nr:hypothetical protein BD560DRAFT_441937 [Blakeslea trispora]
MSSLYFISKDVRPIIVDEAIDEIAEDVAIEEDKNQEQEAEVDMSDIPVELEIRLKKETKHPLTLD